MLYVTEDCRYHSVDELINRSAVVLRRVYQDKIWALINTVLIERAKYDPEQVWFDPDPVTPQAINFINPFIMPNSYIEEIFRESIDYTNLDTPIFKTSKIFLQSLSVRRNYQQIVDRLILNLLEDGLRNPFHYSAAIVYFLNVCMVYNWYMNRQNPSPFSERDLYYGRLIDTYCHEITSMATQVAIQRNEAFNQNYDLDTLLYDVIGTLDNCIIDTIWLAHVGQDVCPLEGGLSEAYDYFEDDPQQQDWWGNPLQEKMPGHPY